MLLTSGVFLAIKENKCNRASFSWLSHKGRRDTNAIVCPCSGSCDTS